MLSRAEVVKLRNMFALSVMITEGEACTVNFYCLRVLEHVLENRTDEKLLAGLDVFSRLLEEQPDMTSQKIAMAIQMLHDSVPTGEQT
jgi:hypothetical protein